MRISENEELTKVKMSKVNTIPRFKEGMVGIGIGILCGFFIFYSGTSSKNIQGTDGQRPIDFPEPDPYLTISEIRYDNLDLHITMEQERLHERDRLEEKDQEIIRLQSEIANLRSQTTIKADTTSSQQSTDVSKSKELMENDGIDDINSPQTKVLLITAHRSGSTFLGELFNQNENVFYLFEPLAAIQSKMSTTGCDENPEEKIR